MFMFVSVVGVGVEAGADLVLGWGLEKKVMGRVRVRMWVGVRVGVRAENRVGGWNGGWG